MRYGVLDLTSESLSLTVVEPTRGGQLRTVRRDTVRLRLVRRHDGDQVEAPAGMSELAVETLRRLVAVANRVNCQHVRATLRADLLDTAVASRLTAELGRVLTEPARQLTHEDQARLLRRARAGSDDPQHAVIDLADAVVLDAISRGSEVAAAAAERATAIAGLLAAYGRSGDRHSAQVARLSGRLFDLLASVHRLPPSDRELLQHGAWLHDLGRGLGPAARHRLGAEVVESADLQGFTGEWLEAVACLVRFHKGRPPGNHYAPFTRMTSQMRDRVTGLVTLLRLADGLDRGHDQSVVALRAEVEDEVVLLDLRGDRLDLSLFGARSSAALFERVMGRRLIVRALSPATAHGNGAEMAQPSWPFTAR